MCSGRRDGYSRTVSTITGQLRDRRTATAQSIAPLRHAVTAFAARGGATSRQCQDIALAVSEALTNVVQHAYREETSPGVMAMQAALSEGSLEVDFRDDGAGLPPPAEHPATGLGLALIAKVADRLELRDRTPGTRVSMTFTIG